MSSKGSVTSALGYAKVNLTVTLPSGTTAYPKQGSMTTTAYDGRFSMDLVASAVGKYQFAASYAGDNRHTATAKSINMTVIDTRPPAPEVGKSSIALSSASNTATTGQTLHAEGALTSSFLSGTVSLANAQVTLSVILPNGQSAVPTQGSTVLTALGGIFSMDYVASSAGTYKFAAQYSGDSTHTSASKEVSFTVTDPVPPPTDGATEYSGVVYQTFTTSSYSVSAINSALAACPSGQAVKLAAGTYLLNGVINVPAGKTLVGSTDGAGGIGTVISTTLTGSAVKENGYINIGSGENTVRNIKTLSGYYFFGLNSHDFLFQDCEYNGPTDSSAGLYYLCGFFIYIGANGNYDNGCFLRCVAKNAPCYGFLVCADGTKNSNHNGANSYTAHDWSWTACEAYGCGIANINYPNYFVYGCGFNFFEGFGVSDDVVGMRITNCIANGNAADGFHIEYMMDIVDCVFTDCTANNNGQWFKMGRTTDPPGGVLIGTGFYLGGAVTSQTKVINCLAQTNWGYSTRGGGYGMVDSLMHSDLDGTYVQGTGAS